MAIFKNRIIIHNGKMDLRAPSLALYQVRAEGAAVRAVQTTPVRLLLSRLPCQLWGICVCMFV